MHTSRAVGLMLASLCSGCALLTPPLEQPVIEEKLNPRFLKSATVGTLSLTPERRVVLANFANDRFCAEPPTEVGMDVSRVLQAAAKLSIEGKGNAGVEGTLANTFQNAVLNKRTQGLQYFLASSFYLCQMYMNNAIGPEALVRLQIEMINAAGPLIEKELQYLHQTPPARSQFVPLDPNKALQSLNRPATGGSAQAPDSPASAPPKPQQ